jgi:O-antigen/teichoic acid export membrane protein
MLEGMSTATAERDVLDAPQAGHRAVRGSALRSGGYVGGILLSLISVPLLIRHLGFEQYGAYVAITAIVTIVAGVSDLGVTSVGVREWAARDDPDERHALLSNLLGTRLVITLLGALGAMGFGVVAGYDATRLAGMAVACGGLFALACYEALAVPLQAELRQGWIALVELLRQAVQVALILTLIAVGAGLVPLLAAAIPGGLAAVALTAAVSRRALVRPAVHPRAWWALMRPTIPFAAASALGVVYLRTTVVLTSLVASELQSGYFATAFRVMEVAIGVPVLLIGALFPILARAAAADRERLQAAIARIFEMALACGALVAVCVAAGAPLAIEVLTGEASAVPAMNALGILGVGLGFSFIGASSQYALLAIHRHRAILLINVVALLLNVTLTLALAPTHGAGGAALALSISEATVATLATVLLKRSQKGLFPPWPILARIALTATLGGAAALALKGVGSIPEALGAGLVCACMALLFGLLPRELWALRSRRRGEDALRAQDTGRSSA